MRGQWSSQTRRMNRHYQTGDAGDVYQHIVMPGSATYNGILRSIISENMATQGAPYHRWDKWYINIVPRPTLIESIDPLQIQWYLRIFQVYCNRKNNTSVLILNETYTTQGTGQPFYAGNPSTLYYGDPLSGNIYQRTIQIPANIWQDGNQYNLRINATFYAAGDYDAQDTCGYEITIKEGV